MPRHRRLLVTADAFRRLGLWLLLVTPVAALTGSASALFLWSLDRATRVRFEHSWLLFLLPLAGAGIAWIYHRFGRETDRGNNLIIDEIHQPGAGVPARITPFIFVTTVATHLFGGSAGREGTAVQMGSGLASAFARLCHIPDSHRSMLLMAGVAAGFGSVFGTPLAGAVFALEALTIGRIHYARIVPCLIASFVGDLVCTAWGAHHPRMNIAGDWLGDLALGHLNLLLFAKVALAGIAFGLCARAFSRITHSLGAAFKRYVPIFWIRPVIGGVIVIALTYALGTREYLGLGTLALNPGDTTTSSVFYAGGADTWSWFWKLLFTAVTLGAGFKGGEVTPLFFIGGALGNTLAGILEMPVDIGAGLGFVAVFAGASNTPVACTLMAIELFGVQHAVFFALACWMSYQFSGHTGIYPAQLLGTRKKIA